MAPPSSTLAWKVPWMEEPARLQSMGLLRVGHDWVTSLSHIGEGNGNPLQCSCLENPRDGGAWWAAVYGITQSRTRLKWLSSNSSKESGNSPYLPHQKQTNKQKQWYTISHFVHLWNKDNSPVSFMAMTKKSSYKRLSWTLLSQFIMIIYWSLYCFIFWELKTTGPSLKPSTENSIWLLESVQLSYWKGGDREIVDLWTDRWK